MTLLVLNDFHDLPGGGTALAQFCARGLAARGADVLYVAGCGAPADCEPGRRVASLGLRDVREGGVRGAIEGVYSRTAARALRRLLRDHPPQTTTVLLHQWTRVLSPAVFEVLRDYRVLVFAHDFFLTCPNGVLYDFKRRQPCPRTPMSVSCKLADCDRESRLHKLVRVARTAVQDRLIARMRRLEVVFISQGQADRYGALFPRGAATHVLPNVPLHLGARAAVPSPTTDGVLFIGRLVEEKGVMELAEATRRCAMACTFVGGGPLYGSLARLYPEHRVEPWSSPQAVAALTRAARAVVIPSRWPETACMAAMEPLEQGVPVAMAAVICSSAELEAAGGCVSFDAGSVEGVEAMLLRIASPDWKAASAAAKRRAAELAGQDRRAGYLNALEALAAGDAKARPVSAALSPGRLGLGRWASAR